MESKMVRRILIAAVVLNVPFVLSAVAFAQADQYKPGDKIEYKVMGSYPEKWEKDGTYVGTTPGGSQPIIREKPSEFYPDGAQRASDWNSIRPMGKPNAAPPKVTHPAPVLAPDDLPANNKFPAGDNDGGGCDSMLSEDDVLSFFQQKLGNDPFKDSAKKERVENEMAAKIRDCGVNFRYSPISPFGNKLGKFGAISTTTMPLERNFGPPTKQAWYIGTWINNVQSEDYWMIVAAKIGFLKISANGSYTWKLYASDPPSKYVKGTWRPATADEMKVSYQGGEGIVLNGAKLGYDWIVRQDRETTLKGRWIVIANINSRSQREFGFQK
ncbi:hypothetical protein BH10ACI3_BH10ACI3_00020 [soil metagenome]